MKHDFAVNLIEDFWRTRPEELTELDLLEQWCRRYPRKE
jgi:hypothetical protein